MTDPLTLLILVASGELTDATTRGMATATRDALGPVVHVVVSETHTEPDDAQAIARERSEHADAVVELRWGAPHRRHATIRMHIVRNGRWIERGMTFRASDADAERGRTLGLTIASILPDAPSPAPAEEPGPAPAAGVGEEARPPEGASPDAPAAPAPSSTPAPAPSSPASPPSTSAPAPPSGPAASGPAAAPAPPPVAKSQTEAAPEHARSTGDASAPPPAPPDSSGESNSESAFGRTALDLFLVGASAFDSGSRGVGGAGAFHWFPVGWMSFRVGFAGRVGAIDEAQGDLLTLFGAAGVALHPWPVRPGRLLGVSLRADYLFLYEKLTHFALSNDQNPEVQDGVLSGADAVVDGEWLFTPNVEAIVGVGLEAFAPTFIDINGSRVTSIPLLRAVGEAGLRLRF